MTAVLDHIGRPIGHVYSVGDLRLHGAKLDGVTDDSAAVLAWLEAGADGSSLYHPGGTALCSTWTEYVATEDIRIWSDSPNAVLKGTTSLDFLRPAGGDISVENIEFNTWRQVFENDLSDTGTTDVFTLKNVRIITTGTAAISHERPLNRAFFDQLYFSGIVNAAIHIGDNDDDEQDTWKLMQLSNITVADVSNTGTGSAFGILLYGERANLSNIHVGTVTVANSPATAAGVYTKVRFLNENNITVEEVTSTGTATDIAAVTVKGARRAQTGSGPQSFDTNVSNVVVKHTKRVGFRMQHGGWAVASNIIIEDTDLDGITIDEPDAGNIILNGFVVRSDTAAGTVGVRLSTDAENYKILNGIIDGPALGVRIDSPTSGTAKNIEVGSVAVLSCATAAIALNSEQNVDKINVHHVTADAACANGFLTTGAGTFTELVVSDCDFADVTGSPVILSGTTTAPKFRNVKGYVTANSGTGSIASGATTAVVSHGLAVTPTLDDISVVFGEQGTNDYGRWWVSNITSTQFTLNVSADPGASNLDFAWRADASL